VIRSEKNRSRGGDRGRDRGRDGDRSLLNHAQRSVKRELDREKDREKDRDRERDDKYSQVSGTKSGGVSVNMLIGADTSKALADFSHRLADHIAHTANTGETQLVEIVFYRIRHDRIR
jgi:hypothetical protein